MCPALCEAACTCGDVTGSSVTVRENEHAIIETAYAKNWLTATPPPTRTGKSVAVVGSGPAGLSVAEYLNKRGHAVTVFERADRLGGLLMYGIPNMKLDKAVIERRVKLMQAEGVVFRTGMDVGGAVPAEQLLADFDAVVLCCGAKKPRDLNVPGRDAKGVHFAVDYLTAAPCRAHRCKPVAGVAPGAEDGLWPDRVHCQVRQGPARVPDHRQGVFEG